MCCKYFYITNNKSNLKSMKQLNKNFLCLKTLPIVIENSKNVKLRLVEIFWMFIFKVFFQFSALDSHFPKIVDSFSNIICHINFMIYFSLSVWDLVEYMVIIVSLIILCSKTLKLLCSLGSYDTAFYLWQILLCFNKVNWWF